MHLLIVRRKIITNLIVAMSIILITFGVIISIDFSRSISTNSTPITSKVVVLDAGHGLPDYGTTGKNGTTEQEINLAVTLKLQQIIELNCAKVILTRSDENGIYELDKDSIREKKVSDMKNRVYIGNNSNADLYISIHMNYYEQGRYKGWQTFYKLNNESSKKLAGLIQESLNENISKINRIPMPIKGAYIMDKLNIPAVIVECGFLSNYDDEIKLKDGEYQNKLAWGIYIGIQKYFEVK